MTPEELCPEAQTPLGKRLYELRRRIVAGGTPLHDWDDLDLELYDAVTNETRRCADLVDAMIKAWSHDEDIGNVLNGLMYDMLRTGGLPVTP